MMRLVLLGVVGFLIGTGGAVGIVWLRTPKPVASAEVRPDSSTAGSSAAVAEADPAEDIAMDSSAAPLLRALADAVAAVPRDSLAAGDSTAVAAVLTANGGAVPAAGHPSTVESEAPAAAPSPVPAAPDSIAGPIPGQRLAKVFGAMQPKEAARVLEQMDDRDVAVILGRLNDRQAAAVLANLSPQRAAAISRNALHGTRNHP